MRGRPGRTAEDPGGPAAAPGPARGLTRRAFLAGAAATAAPTLAACRTASTAGAGSSPEPLQYVVLEDQDWISRATADLAAFAATRPGFPVTTRSLTLTEYDDEAARLAVADDPPALMWHRISRAGFADLVTSGAATDLTALWATALRDVSPAVADWYSTRGRRYAVPLNVVLYPLICYDVALFRRLGITPPPRDTRSWPEPQFLEACATLRAAGLDPLAVAGLDLSQQLAEAIAVTMLSPEELRRYTVDAWKPGSPFRYTDEVWTQVFTRLQGWARGSVFEPRAARTDRLAALQAFVGGVAGMVAGGSWTVGDVQQQAAQSGAHLDLDWMLFPTITRPNRLLSFAGEGAFIPAASPHQAQAEKVLAFILGQDRMIAAARAYGHIPPLTVPGLDRALDARVVSMLEFSARRGGPCMNWPTEIEGPFARACRAVLAGTSTPAEAGQDLEDAATLARAAAR